MPSRGLLHITAPQPAASSEDAAFDSESYDFTTYLARRIGSDSAMANEILGHWLLIYEPTERQQLARSRDAATSGTGINE